MKRSIILAVAVVLAAVSAAEAKIFCLDQPSTGWVFKLDVKPNCTARKAGQSTKISAVHGVAERNGGLVPVDGTCLSRPGTWQLFAHSNDASFILTSIGTDRIGEANNAFWISQSGPWSLVSCADVGL